MWNSTNRESLFYQRNGIYNAMLHGVEEFSSNSAPSAAKARPSLPGRQVGATLWFPPPPFLQPQSSQPQSSQRWVAAKFHIIIAVIGCNIFQYRICVELVICMIIRNINKFLASHITFWVTYFVHLGLGTVCNKKLLSMQISLILY